MLNWLTSGGYYYHMFTVHDLPWFQERFVGFITGLVRAYGLFLVPGMLALVVGVVFWIQNATPTS